MLEHLHGLLVFSGNLWFLWSIFRNPRTKWIPISWNCRWRLLDDARSEFPRGNETGRRQLGFFTFKNRLNQFTNVSKALKGLKKPQCIWYKKKLFHHPLRKKKQINQLKEDDLRDIPPKNTATYRALFNEAYMETVGTKLMGGNRSR